MNAPAARVTAFLFLMCVVPPAAESRASPLYSITDLGPTDNSRSIGGMNDAGQVVGNVFNSKAGKGYAFVYDGTAAGTVTPLGGSADPINYSAIRDTRPLGMNNSGQIIVLDQQGAVAGTPDSYFVYSSGNGQITRLPGGASSINDQGQVVVSASNPTTGGPVSAYLYNLATRSLQALVAPGSAPVEATAVNNAGQVAGFLYTSPSETAASAQPFLYSNGKMINIGAPDGLYGNALAINSQGDVVGLAKTATDASFHAFLYSNGVMKDLGTLPGGQGSWASSINNLGQIVGESWPGAGVGGAGGFLYSGGVMKDLNSLIDPNSPWWIYWAFQINNRGQILGIAESSMGEHYVLLTPEGLPRPGDAVYPTIVPEPSTWLLFAPLIGGLAIRHVRRRQVTQAG